MELREMETSALEERAAAISAETDVEGADLDALETEARAIKAELEARVKAADKAAEERKAIAAGETETKIIDKIKETKEERKMELVELRKSEKYVNAFANYIKSNGKEDGECRALLSENGFAPGADGPVPVPAIVYDIVKNAWEKDGIARRVKKAYLRGNLKVGFEISADGAVIHNEGGEAIDPEGLVLGIVEIQPKSIKKLVQISDEAYDLAGEAFLRYIYDEITYQIAKKAVDTLLTNIASLSTTATTTAVNIGAIDTTQITVSLIAEALAELSDQASNPVVVMNRATWGAFKAAQAANGFNYDPFEGLPVEFNNSLPAFATASATDPVVIVGDFEEGALFNFPNGDEIKITVDPYTNKAADIVDIMGREFVGIGVVGPKSFCVIYKDE